MTKDNHIQSGFSLVEMVLYVSLLLMIMVVIINIVFTFSRSHEELGATRSIEQSALMSIERMVRDIHAALDYNAGTSVFGTSPGTLSLTTGATTTRFYVQNGQIRVDVNGAYVGPLTASNASTTLLVFTPITSADSKAIKIDLTISATQGRVTKTKSYHTTAILKKS